MNSQELFARAQQVIPGGVNSPVRAFRAVGGMPIFVDRAQGSHLLDVEGRSYLDYCMSWGAIILGHAHPVVVEAIESQVRRGTSFGTCHELEVLMAERICEALPSTEMVRFTSSGTEAVMSALRLARGYTGRTLIVKFSGCYHGHVDSLLVRGGSGLLTLGVPDSLGVPEAFAQTTILLSYNHIEEVEETFSRWGERIAAVIVEPVAGNMGVVIPRREFLETLRQITLQYGTLLIFDEVITGFRISYSGAQGYYGITPDLTVLGKIVGGGLPVGVYGGRRAIMQHVAPEGKVYQAGTLSGNPLTLSAGYAVLTYLKDHPEVYRELEHKARRLALGMESIFQDVGIPVHVNQIGSMLTLFFNQETVHDDIGALRTDRKRYAWFFHEMLHRGVYLPPSPFEAMFLSLEHRDDDINFTLEVVHKIATQRDFFSA
ncbi:MAG: glutamate-1-semialdehyde 2,1-aminomutase [Atribacterota bacterium]